MIPLLETGVGCDNCHELSNLYVVTRKIIFCTFRHNSNRWLEFVGDRKLFFMEYSRLNLPLRWGSTCFPLPFCRGKMMKSRLKESTPSRQSRWPHFSYGLVYWFSTLGTMTSHRWHKKKTHKQTLVPYRSSERLILFFAGVMDNLTEAKSLKRNNREGSLVFGCNV